MKKRLSGNFFERLVFYILPWTLLFPVFSLITAKSLNSILIPFFLLTIAFWILDVLIIFFKFKNPKRLLYKNGALYLGNEEINITTLESITPITDKRYKWAFRMVELHFINGDKKYLIDRTVMPFNDLSSCPSKTIEILVSFFPSLGAKTQRRKFI